MNIRQQLASQLSSSIQAKKEAILMETVSAYLGYGAYDFRCFIGRFSCVTIQNTGIETYCIDGIPLVEFFPVAFPEINGHIAATFKYRRIQNA